MDPYPIWTLSFPHTWRNGFMQIMIYTPDTDFKEEFWQNSRIYFQYLKYIFTGTYS